MRNRQSVYLINNKGYILSQEDFDKLNRFLVVTIQGELRRLISVLEKGEDVEIWQRVRRTLDRVEKSSKGIVLSKLNKVVVSDIEVPITNYRKLFNYNVHYDHDHDSREAIEYFSTLLKLEGNELLDAAGILIEEAQDIKQVIIGDNFTQKRALMVKVQVRKQDTFSVKIGNTSIDKYKSLEDEIKVEMCNISSNVLLPLMKKIKASSDRPTNAEFIKLLNNEEYIYKKQIGGSVLTINIPNMLGLKSVAELNIMDGIADDTIVDAVIEHVIEKLRTSIRTNLNFTIKVAVNEFTELTSTDDTSKNVKSF